MRKSFVSKCSMNSWDKVFKNAKINRTIRSDQQTLHTTEYLKVMKACDYTHSLSLLPILFTTGYSLYGLVKSSYKVHHKWTETEPPSVCDCSH